jgi:hypothetical protein
MIEIIGLQSEVEHLEAVILRAVPFRLRWFECVWPDLTYCRIFEVRPRTSKKARRQAHEVFSCGIH